MRIGKYLIVLIALVVSVNVCLYLIAGSRRSSVELSHPVEDNADTRELNQQLEELERKLAYQLELQREIVRVLREEANRWKTEKNYEALSDKAVKSEEFALIPSVEHPETSSNLVKYAGDPVVQTGSFPDNLDVSFIPVLLLACNRAEFVTRTLEELIRVRGDYTSQHPIIVSQDCRDAQTERAIRRFSKDIAAYLQQPDQSGFVLPPNQNMFEGYYRIARHYRFAIDKTFSQFNQSIGIIIVEDDLSVAPDFFEYFRAGARILQVDPSLWCMSAWNDNGKPDLVLQNASLLHRTDFFPGLGWLLPRHVWTDLAPRWPRAFWDDWMRQPDQRKGRACIRPEIGRSSTFGRSGVSNGQFFDKFLQYVQHTDTLVEFTKYDLSYLIKERYDPSFLRDVYTNSILMTLGEVQAAMQNIPPDWTNKPPIRIEYITQPQFDAVASHFGLMRDYKNGVPRTAYFGVVSFGIRNRRVFLAPPSKWSGYDDTWKSPS